MTPLEKYKTREHLIKEFSSKMLEIADELLKKDSLECNHQYKYVDDIYYFCGETYPGWKCTLCGDKTRTKPEQKKGWFK